jgi:hypothetical protein
VRARLDIRRNSADIATRSSSMQLTAFVLSECALPIRDRIGDGGLYTLFAGILTISSAVFILLAYKVSNSLQSDVCPFFLHN